MSEKAQPKDSTGKGKGGTAAPQGKDGYQVKGKGQNHQMPKHRQDGKGSKRGTNAGDHLWKHTDSEQEGNNFK